MSIWLIMVPLVSAFIGWCFTKLAIRLLFYPRRPVRLMGFTVQGVILKRQQSFSVSAATILSQELVSFSEIEQKILDPDNLQKIIPEIEKHIDYFLRVKLKDAMPMVAMFVGDKTIIQLKEVFMTEMETLFPVIMKSYVEELQKEFNVEEIITRKLASLSPEIIESFFLKTFRNEFRYAQVAGAGIGFATGMLQVIITLFMQP